MDQQAANDPRLSLDRKLERRVVRTPRLGARITLLIAALMLVAAGYYLFSPVRVVATDGGSWDCGTALSAQKDAFGKGLCGRQNDIFKARAFAFGLAAAVTAVGGFMIFGSDRRVEARPRRRPEVDDL
jgi:hypothetical protein